MTVSAAGRSPAIPRDRDRLIGRGDPELPRYERICCDKADIPGKRQAVLVAPGHPLLSSLCRAACSSAIRSR